MAAVAGELSKQIKGHSEGVQGFRPWWDTFEDNLMYAFVILGEECISRSTRTMYYYNISMELQLFSLYVITLC